MHVEIVPAKNQRVPINSQGETCDPSDVNLGVAVESRTGRPYDRGHVLVTGDAQVFATTVPLYHTRVEMTSIRTVVKGAPKVAPGSVLPWEVGILACPSPQNTGDNVLQIRRLEIETDDGIEEVYSAFLLEATFVMFGFNDDSDYEAHLPGKWPDSEVVFQANL